MSDTATEELRLALVMNGGVSLAVWMGGVTNEIFRLVNRIEPDPIYTQLLALTRSTARVDVISGTSAGGVNGGALAVALMYGGRFEALRDVWLKVGAFSSLLRPPLGSNPGSLMMGDEYFLPEIEKGFNAIAPSEAPRFTPEDLPLDLRLTTTLLGGEHGRHLDDLGSAVNDVDHRAHFHFQYLDERNDFTVKRLAIKALARAARSTASFPFAFEPSLLDPQDPSLKARLCNSQGVPLTGARYLVDGGLMDNKPFRGALGAIFRMPRQGGVRRVLAYINPDPGDTTGHADRAPTPAATASAPADAPAQGQAQAEPRGHGHRLPEMPPLAEVLRASMLGIPQSQAIADQLRDIEQHNDDVRARRSSVLALTQTLNDDALASLARQLFPVYRKRRVANTFELIVYPLLRKLGGDTRLPQPDQLDLGQHSRAQLKWGFEDDESPGARQWDAWLPASWAESPDDPRNQIGAPPLPQTWEWGMFPVEFGVKVLLDLLRMTQHLQDYADTTPGEDAQLARAWKVTYAVVRELTQRRQAEEAIWLQASGQFVKDIAGIGVALPNTNLRATLKDAYFKMFAFVATEERRLFCATQAHLVAQWANEASPLAARIARQALTNPSLRPHDQARAQGLVRLAGYLQSPRTLVTLHKLLQLEVIEYAFTDHEDLSCDTLIELVQISGQSRSPIGGETEARYKLLGLQLAHFAAFYKQSWRANDWIYGRLDGAERLVKIVLNPERLHRFFFKEADAALQAMRDIAYRGLPAQSALRDELDGYCTPDHMAQMRRELAFLDGIDQKLPDKLQACADLITLRLHYDILLEELPTLRRAIEHDQSEGADAAGPAQAVLQALRPPAMGAAKQPVDVPVTPSEAAALLRRGLIGQERMLEEAGSDLFTRTVGHTLATLQNTLASKASKLGPISVVFTTLKLPIMAFYLVSQVLTRQSRTRAAVHGALLAAGVALVSSQFFWSPADLAKDGMPGAWVTTGWALLSLGLIMSIIRSPMTASVVVLLWVGVAIYLKAALGVALAVAGIILVAFIRGGTLVSSLAGLAMIGVAALWGSGQWGKPFGTWVDWGLQPVLGLAALIGVALIVAIFQASTWSRRIEATLRAGIKGNAATKGASFWRHPIRRIQALIVVWRSHG